MFVLAFCSICLSLLASFFGGDCAILSGYADSQVSQKTKPKSGRSKKNDSLMEEEASKIDDREEILAICKTKDEGSEFEALPLKDVAFYRVRWNNKKGSERWLCYGGAAGIIRCQQITL